MKFRMYAVLALFVAAPLLPAQTVPVWSEISAESATVMVTLPAGTTYRFGDVANNLWSAPITVTSTTTFNPVSFPAGVFPFADPDPNVVKVLQVLETTAPQTISVTDLATAPQTLVSMVVPSLLPPTTIPMLPGTTYTLTFSNFAIAPGTPAGALLIDFVNKPTSHANQAWEGTQMNLTIDGVTLVCTYGQTYTDGIFRLNCSVPATPPTQ